MKMRSVFIEISLKDSYAKKNLRAAAKLDPPAPPTTDPVAEAAAAAAAAVEGCTAAVDRILAEEGDDVGVVDEVMEGDAAGGGAGAVGAGDGGGIAPSGGSICCGSSLLGSFAGESGRPGRTIISHILS